jgi:hypothetical protein
MGKIVVLGDVWSNKGFLGMPPQYRSLFWEALRVAPPEPIGKKPDIVALYNVRMSGWVSGGATLDARLINNLAGLEAVSVFHKLTISDIVFDDETFCLGEIKAKNAVWRWQFHGFAFSVFWALSYHLQNDAFVHPKETWNGLLYLVHERYPRLKEGTNEWRILMLALYERVAGMEYDQKQGLSHYRHNIVERRGLGRQELAIRAEAFDGYIKYCRERIEAELR